jgi:hypothetical protein
LPVERFDELQVRQASSLIVLLCPNRENFQSPCHNLPASVVLGM